MNLEAFLRARAELRARRPDLLDLSELDLYRSLARLDPTHFGPIAPSTHPEAPYRCHLAERYLAHLGLPAALKPRTQVSHGVRRSLRALFGLLAARGATVGIPDDVYPVYGRLAAEAGARVVPWSAYAGLPDDAALSTLGALLVCEPCKPWGRGLSAAEVTRLRAWARQDDARLLILDSAYATPPSAASLALVEDASAALLVSLSKGWLIPDHAGLCVVPSRLREAARGAFAALPKDPRRLRIGYAALTEHASRAAHVASALDALAAQLDARTAARPELAATRCAGYFATAARSFEQLLELGVLAVPASVFGAPEGTPRCVLTSLPVAG